MDTTADTQPFHIRRLAELRQTNRDPFAPAEHADYVARLLEQAENSAVEIQAVLDIAAANGWTARFAPQRITDGKEEKLVFTRGDEELTVAIGSTTGMDSVRGWVATGPVSSRRVDSRSFVRVGEVQSLLGHKPRSEYADTEWVLVVGHDRTERRSYETASDYAEFRLTPGVYPVEIVDLHHRADPQPGVDGRQPYWAIASVPATQFHSYCVNRLFTAASVDESWEESQTTLDMRVYTFQLEKGDVATELPEDMTGKAVYIRRAELERQMRPDWRLKAGEAAAYDASMTQLCAELRALNTGFPAQIDVPSPPCAPWQPRGGE